MKKIAVSCLLIFIAVADLSIADAGVKQKGRYKEKAAKEQSQKGTGLIWGISLVSGACIPGDPDRMAGRSGTYWSAAGPWTSFGWQILADGYYYFKPEFALNFGIGFGSYRSKWSGEGETFGDPEIMDYKGYNIMPRIGVSNLYNGFFITAGLLAAPTVSSSYSYTGTAETHIFSSEAFPYGVYANIGYRFDGGGSTKIPVGFEFMLLDKYCWDYNGYRIIMWTYNAYIGILF